MPTEITRMTAQPGRGDELVAAIREFTPACLAQPGIRSGTFLTQLDDVDVALCVIDWESAQALDEAVASPAGQAFLGAIGGLLTGAPDIRMTDPV